MGPTFGGKIVISIVGVLLAVFFVLFFPWWLSLLALFAMVPFFLKVLMG